MRIVNGYLCDCSDDARLAKRGIDPANPQNDPIKQQQLDARRGKIDLNALDETRAGDLDPNRQTGQAVTFGGSLAGETRTGGSGGNAPATLVDRLV